MIWHYTENLKYNHSTGHLCNEKGEGKRPDHTILQGKTSEATTESERDWPVISHSKCIIWTSCTSLNWSCLTLTLQKFVPFLICLLCCFMKNTSLFHRVLNSLLSQRAKGLDNNTREKFSFVQFFYVILCGLLKASHAELYIWCCSFNASLDKCNLIFRIL